MNARHRCFPPIPPLGLTSTRIMNRRRLHDGQDERYTFAFMILAVVYEETVKHYAWFTSKFDQSIAESEREQRNTHPARAPYCWAINMVVAASLATGVAECTAVKKYAHFTMRSHPPG